MVDAGFVENNRVFVQTDNIRTFSLGPIEHRNSNGIVVDGQDLGEVDLSRKQNFQQGETGAWKHGDFNLSKEKRHSSSGPIGDLFFDGLILVPGTAGSEEETFFNSWIARNAQQYYRSRNGGVHRGGIMGENWVDLPIVDDRELEDDVLVNNNLLLYGTYTSNSVLAQFEKELPLVFDGTTIHLSDKTYTSKRAAILAVFPHPRNPERYVAVHGGVVPDAICWGSHLDMHLIPDYLVYSEGELLDWGFWGNKWKCLK
jgi:hypothetical protein